jgi:putative MATE family efflux protein
MKERKKKSVNNRMGIAPVPGLLLKMGIPMMFSLALQAVYNIVDSYFVSMIADTPGMAYKGDLAVNALTLAFPIQMLMVAVGVGTGVGVSALLSRRLGQGEAGEAGRVAGNGIFLGLVSYLAFLLFSRFGVLPYLASQTTDARVLAMGADYLGITMTFSTGLILFVIYEKILQGSGRSMLSTVAQVSGALTNLLLDPILIFGYLGAPALGIRGAAYATVIGQTVSLLVGAVFHHGLNREVRTCPRHLLPDARVIRGIYRVGIPAIVMQGLMSVMNYGVNILFGSVSLAAVTAYGVYYKIQQFVVMAAFGMNNAMVPVIAYNRGRKDLERVRSGIRYGLLYLFAIMGIGAFGLQFFAGELLGLFALSSEVQVLGVRAIRIITLGFLFAGGNIAYQGVFQALGRGVHALVVAAIRMIVVTLPLAWFFVSRPGASHTIWMAFPIAEGVAFLLAQVMMKRILAVELQEEQEWTLSTEEV